MFHDGCISYIKYDHANLEKLKYVTNVENGKSLRNDFMIQCKLKKVKCIYIISHTAFTHFRNTIITNKKE